MSKTCLSLISSVGQSVSLCGPKKEKISKIEVKKEENITMSREKAPPCGSKVIKPILRVFPHSGVRLVGIYEGQLVYPTVTFSKFDSIRWFHSMLVPGNPQRTRVKYK